jgi:hypothetical protein
MNHMKKLLMKVSLLICSLFVAMIIMELVLRIFFNEEGRRSVRYDKDLGWAGIPLSEGIYYYRGDNLHSRYKFNELGFRGELISSLPDSSTRLVFLGDSFVESLEVDYDSTFHRQVERMLKNNIDNNIDVVNISSQNYGTAQEILALDKYQDIIRPRIVILFFYTGNDFEDNARARFAVIDKKGQLQWNNQRDSWLKEIYLSSVSWLYDKSHLVYFVRNFVLTEINLNIFANSAAVNKVDDSDEYKRKMTELLILNLKEKLQAKKIPFGVVIFPHKNEIIKNNSSKSDFIAQLCSEQHISCLNFYGILEPAYYLKIDEHFNPNGHRIVTSKLYDFLVKNFLFNRNVSNIQ